MLSPSVCLAYIYVGIFTLAAQSIFVVKPLFIVDQSVFIVVALTILYSSVAPFVSPVIFTVLLLDQLTGSACITISLKSSVFILDTSDSDIPFPAISFALVLI